MSIPKTSLEKARKKAVVYPLTCISLVLEARAGDGPRIPEISQEEHLEILYFQFLRFQEQPLPPKKPLSIPFTPIRLLTIGLYTE